MINTSDDKSRTKTAKEAEARTRRRAEQAQIVSGLQELLEADEQLLGFTRGLIAGGLRGKLTVGFEALFAPYVNIGLTERRVVLQHVQPESGKPNDILPHSFPLSELQSVAFSDIETFGGDPDGRLNLRLFNDQHFRLRLRGTENVQNAKTISDVFGTLTSTRPKARTSPTQSVCPHCDQVMDRVSRFCPYCGHALDVPESAVVPVVSDTAPASEHAPESTMAPPSEAANSADKSASVNGHAEGNGSPEPDRDVSAESEDGATGSQEDGLIEERTADRPVRPWAEDSPTVETIVEDPPAEMATEGHEASAGNSDHAATKNEGDRQE